jgi:hypothetical protein
MRAAATTSPAVTAPARPTYLAAMRRLHAGLLGPIPGSTGRGYARAAVAGLALCLLGAAALPGAARAQVVGGTVRERDSQAPLRAALVVLLDSAGKERVASLTDDQGTFVLRAPVPGRYHVRAEHIGHDTASSDPFALGAGATVRVALQLGIAPILLQPLQVAAESRCRMRPGAAEATARLWEEARKALRLSRLTRQSQSMSIRKYRSTVDATKGIVLVTDTLTQFGRVERPFHSDEDEDSLHTAGYFRDLPGGGYGYFGPDEDVLLSPGFLEHHCIALQEDRDTATGLIGVKFRGVGGKSEIDGVVWLDRASAELRSLDFHYRLPWDIDEDSQGGHIEFTRLNSGVIAVTSYWLRMPIKLAQERDRPTMHVTQYVEEGGYVVGSPAARPASGSSDRDH